MAHMHMIEDDSGDVVDGEYFCSDYCHQEAVGDQYRGWNGCVELDYTQTCENIGCNNILNGIMESLASVS